MTNHIHLVVMPAGEAALHRLLKPLHMRYAQQINRRKGWKGHLWQGRYFSSALDEDYMWAAIRYVERNPVRAKIARKAENHPWSSAAGHCGIKEDRLLCSKPGWHRQFESLGDWSAWLAAGNQPDQLEILRRNADKGLPCGSQKFIHRLEKLMGRAVAFLPSGRPKKGSGKG